MPKSHKGGSGYVKQFQNINPCTQNGGADMIPTCTNTTTTPHQPGQSANLAIDISNPLLNYQLSTPFDGNKFGSGLETVQNTSVCSAAGPGALQQTGAGKKKSTKKTAKKTTPKKKSAKKTTKKTTPKKKSTKKTTKKTTPKKKSTKKTTKKTTPKKKSTKKTTKKTTPKKKTSSKKKSSSKK